MSELPKGWAKSKLGEICSKPQYGYTTRASSEGDVKFLRTTDITKGLNWPSVPYCEVNPENREQYLLQPGDIVISRAGSVGFSSLIESVPASAVFASYLIRFRPIDGILGRYLKRYLESDLYWQQITEKAAGNALQNVNAQKLADLDVIVAPEAEQTRIAQILDELLAQVDTLKARLDEIPALLKRFRQSVLASAVSGRLTEEWRAVNPNTESAEQQVAKINASKTGRLKVRRTDAGFTNDQLFPIPDGWSWIENHRLAEDSNTAICAGPFGTIFKAKDFRDSGVPIIFLRHVAEGVYKTEKPGFMDETVWKELHQEYSVYGGELLVAKLGDPPGTACLYPKGIGTAMVTPDVIKMSIDERVALPKYLMFFFNSQHCKGLIEKLAFGATRLRIDIAMFKGFPIPLPTLEEQTEIVRRVEHLFAFADQLEAKVATAHSRANRLPQSILARAFSGDLTAYWRATNQNSISGENSAAELLKKISAKREIEKKQPRPKKIGTQKKTNKTMSKDIIKVLDALKKSGRPLSGQQLFTAAGYPSDSNTDKLEQFFLDIRDALNNRVIIKQYRDESGQDWFALAEAQ